MRIRIFKIIAALAIALAVMPATVYANLTPTTSGFHVIVQNGFTSAINQDNSIAYDA